MGCCCFCWKRSDRDGGDGSGCVPCALIVALIWFGLT